MKNILMVLGIIFVVIIVIVGGFFAYYFLSAGPLDKESKTWVDTVMPKILETWDPNEIIKNASPEWLQTVPEEKTKEFTDAVRQEFGTLAKYASSTGEAGIRVNNFSTTITAEYIVEADFTKGHGRVFIKGIKENGQWKIFTLFVDRNPNLRWFDGQLTDQPELEHTGDSQVVNGVHYKKLLSW